MNQCKDCYHYDGDTQCTNANSSKYGTAVSPHDTCKEGEFDNTIAEPEDYDGDFDEEDGFDED